MPNLPLCYWSSQLFDLPDPWSSDVSVLLQNQPNESFWKGFELDGRLFTSPVTNVSCLALLGNEEKREKRHLSLFSSLDR